MILDDAARIVSFDDAFARLFAKGGASIRGVDFTSLFGGEDDRASFDRALGQARQEANPVVRTGTWIAADGRLRPVQWWLTRLKQSPQTPHGFVVTGLDLASNRDAWDRAAEREARLQSILDTAVDGIVTIDEQGIIASVNRATEHIFDYRAKELVGRNVKMLMPAPYRQQHDTYLSNYLTTGDKKIIGIGREVEGRRKDGSTFPLDLAVSEFYVAGQRHFMGIMRDVSARKNAEREARRHVEELAHAGRLSALGEMATGIAHEVNQPLTAIVSYAQACLNLLNTPNADEAVLKDALAQISAQGRRAGEIIHHLRQLVRKDQTARPNIDMNASVRAVLDLFTHELNASGVELAVTLEERLPPVRADRVQIEQVVLNLVRNSLDALTEVPDGSRRLSVSTRRQGKGNVAVFVTDSGPGIGGGDPERLFESFYTTKPNGLGVGLSISRSIIDSHGGRLWATENPDGGLSLCFTLPRKKIDEA